VSVVVYHIEIWSHKTGGRLIQV